MNDRSFSASGSGGAWIVWLVAICIVAAGYLLITQRYESKIADSMDTAKSYRERTIANRRVVAQSARVRMLRHRIRRSLTGVLLEKKPPELIAMLLRDVDGLAQRSNSRVLAVVPSNKKSGGGAAGPVEGALRVPMQNALEDGAVDITLRGNFKGLLNFLAALPRRHVLLKVGDVQFSLSGVRSADPKSPLLDAKIHVLIYHIATPQLIGEF